MRRVENRRHEKAKVEEESEESFISRRHGDNPSSMEEKKSHEKGKIASWKKSEETVSESWRKKRRDDDASSSKSNGKDEIAQKERRIEDTQDTRGDASWTRIEKGRKRRGEVIEIDTLNDDLLDEVMLRLPVKSLIRFQIVSKHWRRMIKSRSFSERYLLHQKTQESKFLCLYEDRSWYKRNIVIKKMRSEGSWTCLVEEEDDDIKKMEIVSESVDGLLCFYGYMDLRRQINVINPATRWSYKLPFASIQLRRYFDNKKSRFALPGFGKDYVTGTYKLVWLHNINYNESSSCEVFDFRVKQWRQVIAPPHGHRINQDRLPTFANGWLYWFSQDQTELIAFDLHMEMFQVVPNPIIEASSSSSVYMQMGSIDYDPRLLWISETNGDGMQHVWRLTNHNTGGALLKMDNMFSIDLNKMLSIDLNKITSDPHYSPLFQLEAIYKNGNKVMLSTKTHNLLLFQLLNPTYGIFFYPPPPPSPCDSSLVPYFQSLVSPL